MENGARYVVKTHWGTFSLDEASYRDYLAGKLWISWTPGKPKTPTRSPDDCAPPNVTNRALALRSLAERSGILTSLQKPETQNAPPPYTSRLADISIDELRLTTRSSNGLKRANVHTFEQLFLLLGAEGGILSVRNLGQKSAKEIREIFIEECYSRLLPYEKARYWQEVLDQSSNAQSIEVAKITAGRMTEYE
jgi:hypothetical protein